MAETTITAASVSSTQAELDHAAGPDFRDITALEGQSTALETGQQRAEREAKEPPVREIEISSAGQKRINKRIALYASRAKTAEERLRKYEPDYGRNGNVPQRTEQRPVERPAETQRTAEPQRTEEPEEQAHRARIDQGKRAIPDYDAALERAGRDNLAVPEQAGRAIKQVSNPAQVIHFLTNRPDVCAEMLDNKDRAAGMIQEISQHLHVSTMPELREHNARVLEAGKKQGDFAQLRAAAAKIQIPTFLLPSIAQAENGPDIAIELARHPAVCAELQSLVRRPDAAYLRLGRFIASLDRESSARSKPKSQVSAPVRPVGGGGTASTASGDLDKASYQEYRRRRQAGEG